MKARNETFVVTCKDTLIAKIYINTVFIFSDFIASDTVFYYKMKLKWPDDNRSIAVTLCPAKTENGK